MIASNYGLVMARYQAIELGEIAHMETASEELTMHSSCSSVGSRVSYEAIRMHVQKPRAGR